LPLRSIVCTAAGFATAPEHNSKDGFVCQWFFLKIKNPNRTLLKVQFGNWLTGTGPYSFASPPCDGFAFIVRL